MKAISLFVLMLVSGMSTATPVEYFGTPVFYGKYSSDQFSCSYDTNSHYGFCGDDRAPIEGKVGITNPDAQRSGTGVTMALFTELVCLEGLCKSNYGESLGTISLKSTGYWTIPTGYYLSDVNGQYIAYKHGTGPLAIRYKMHSVYVLPGYNDPPSGIMITENTKYDIYCNEAFECSYLGIHLDRNDLAQYVPKVMTHQCDPTFCYNSDLTIAGLNPKTGVYK